MSTLDLTIQAAAAFALNGAGSFIHESQGQATLTANYAALPAIVYGTATLSQPQASSRVEAAALTVYFADATPGPGDDAAATHATQDRMQALKRRFLAALDAGPLVQLDGIRATPMAGIYEAVLDGIGCQFTVTVPAGVYCLPPVYAPIPAPVLLPTITNFRALVPLETPAIANFAALPA